MAWHHSFIVLKLKCYSNFIGHYFLNPFILYHILAEKRTCAGQHRQNLLNKCPNMIKEHLSSLGPFFFLFPLPFFTCTVQPTCSRIKCMVLISCVHGTTAFSSRKIMLPYKIPLSLYCTQKKVTLYRAYMHKCASL